ncbi:hypothetical protein, partial [Desulfurococcus mucosus]|uniref:hypothetical protein n=1 Tax=Desulfurococcus mucosus TaxID=2275 RepID=UPI00128E7B04
MGVVRLAFGAVLVVTAFYNGGGIDVVIHGAFANASAYLDLFERSLAIADDRYVPPGWLRNDPLYTIEHAAGEVREAVSGWALWRVELPASDGAALEAGSASYRINRVLLLLEEPVAKLESRMRLHDYWEEGNGTVSRITWFTWHFYWTPDLGFWVVVGHPAFALAVRLTHPPGYNLDDLYSYWVPRVTLDVILGNVTYNGRIMPDMSPMVPRYLGGYVCGGASTSTALFASSALGAFSSVIYLASPNGDPNRAHAISLLHYARYRWNSYAETYDVDGDGVDDAVTLVDTARLTKWEVLDRLESLTKFYPGIGTPTMLYTGVANATLALPAWLKAPWLDAALAKALALRPAVVPGGDYQGNIVDAAPANLAMTAGNTAPARVAMEQYRWVVGDPD